MVTSVRRIQETYIVILNKFVWYQNYFVFIVKDSFDFVYQTPGCISEPY